MFEREATLSIKPRLCMTSGIEGWLGMEIKIAFSFIKSENGIVHSALLTESWMRALDLQLLFRSEENRYQQRQKMIWKDTTPTSSFTGFFVASISALTVHDSVLP